MSDTTPDAVQGDDFDGQLAEVERFIADVQQGSIPTGEAMRAYRDVGFDGPIRPDHVPQMIGEDDGEPGYTMLGRLFAYGYIRGLMDATEA